MTETTNQTAVVAPVVQTPNQDRIELNFKAFEASFETLASCTLTPKAIKKVYRALDLAQKAQRVITKLNRELALNTKQKLIVDGLSQIDELLSRMLQGEIFVFDATIKTARRSSVTLTPAQEKKFHRAQALLALAESALLAAARDYEAAPTPKAVSFAKIIAAVNALLTHKNIGLASFHFRKAV